MVILLMVLSFWDLRLAFAMSSQSVLKKGIPKLESQISLSHEFCQEAISEGFWLQEMRKSKQSETLLLQNSMEKHALCDRSGVIRGYLFLKTYWLIEPFLTVQTAFLSTVPLKDEVQAVTFYLLRRFLQESYSYAEVSLETKRKGYRYVYHWLGFIIDGNVARLMDSGLTETLENLKKISTLFREPESKINEGCCSIHGKN